MLSLWAYEYVSNFEKFKDQLSSKENIYSLLTDRKITDREYEHILYVWNMFEMKPMKEYHDLYLNVTFVISWCV